MRSITLHIAIACRCQLLPDQKLLELCDACDDARQGPGSHLHPDWRPHKHFAGRIWYGMPVLWMLQLTGLAYHGMQALCL